MRLPSARGPASQALFSALRDESPMPRMLSTPDPDDFQISLWALYELHYQGFDDVADDLEWDPGVLAGRRQLEAVFEAQLRRQASPLVASVLGEADLITQLENLAAQSAPTLAPYLQRKATRDEFEEFLAERSIYHLKESDPHSWALPRLRGAAKTALAEIQYDEYGAGVPERLHQQLYADALTSVGLDASYGAYVDRASASTLAVNNAMSLFGLHRRLRGACAGHLAAFEMTSSVPCRRLVQGAERLGLPEPVLRYFDEHVEADAVHEQLAVRSLCVPLAAEDPALREDIVFGAATCLALDATAAEETLQAWAAAAGSGTEVA